MCDVIDRIVDRSRNEGRQEGREEGIDIGIDKGINIGIDKGVDKLALLMEKLLDQNRFDDVKKVSKDKEYRTQLLKQFALL